MANICFGCWKESIENCKEFDCSHYGNRDTHLQMDDAYNATTSVLVAKNFSRLIEHGNTNLMSIKEAALNVRNHD